MPVLKCRGKSRYFHWWFHLWNMMPYTLQIECRRASVTLLPYFQLHAGPINNSTHEHTTKYDTSEVLLTWEDCFRAILWLDELMWREKTQKQEENNSTELIGVTRQTLNRPHNTLDMDWNLVVNYSQHDEIELFDYRLILCPAIREIIQKHRVFFIAASHRVF